jgi:hypothetical protein
MAGVMIDIPGIGNVEAKNAATEATLKEILKAMQGGKSGGSSGGGGGSAGIAAAGVAAAAAGKTMGALGKAAGATGAAFTKMAGVAGQAAGSMIHLALNSAEVVDKFANVGDSVERAAGIFRGIPVVGPLLAAVASAATKTVDSFQKASAGGASFGGSLQTFSASASAAGMTMDQFAGMVAKNGEAMRFLGGNTDDGAKRFASLAGGLRKVSGDLYNLGYSTADVNEGLANYTKLAMQGGKNTNMSNQQLISGTKNYMKEMDLLAKVTGETRKQQEDAQAKLAGDAQYQAAMAGMSEDVAASFRNTVTGLPGPLRDVAKDIMATGTATTEESQKFMAMMPESAAMMRDFAAKTQRGEEISLAERNKLNESLRREGKAANDQYKDVGRYSKEFATQTNQFTAAAGIGKDALISGANAQDAATKKKENEAAQMEKAKQKLAEFSNGFQMALLNTGALDSLMTIFSTVADLVMKFVVPAFNFVAGVITRVVGGMEILLAPAIEAISGLLGGDMAKAFEKVDSVLNAVFPVLDGVVRGSIIAFEGLWAGVMSLIEPFTNLGNELFGTGESLTSLTDVALMAGDIVGGAFQFLAGVIGVAVDAITGIVQWLKELGEKSEWVSSAFKMVSDGLAIGFAEMRKYLSKDGFKNIIADISDGFGSMIDSILSVIPNAMGGISAEEQKSRDEARKARAESRNAEMEADVAARDQKIEMHKKGIAEDTKKFEKTKSHNQKLDAENDKTLKAKEKEAEIKKDYNDPIALLKAEAEQQKSGFIKDKPNNFAAAADMGKKALVADADEKTKAADKAKADEEAAKKKKESETAGSAAKPAQETPESLLASLNTKLDQLIKINKSAADVGEKQLSVQRGLTGNLYAA